MIFCPAHFYTNPLRLVPEGPFFFLLSFQPTHAILTHTFCNLYSKGGVYSHDTAA